MSLAIPQFEPSAEQETKLNQLFQTSHEEIKALHAAGVNEVLFSMGLNAEVEALCIQAKILTNARGWLAGFVAATSNIDGGVMESFLTPKVEAIEDVDYAAALTSAT